MSNYLIDTHAHLSDLKFQGSIQEFLAKASSANVQKIISIGCSISEAENSIKIAETYPNVYATVGLYPHENGDETERAMTIEQRLQKVTELASHQKVVAIGECGLDFTPPPPNEISRSKDSQKQLFCDQISIARNLDLPVVIHSRQAANETIRILEQEKAKGDFKAVWHCFTENLDIANKLLELNILMSITGIVTYPSGGDLRATISQIDLTNFMLETDSPYLVPQHARKVGEKVNSPSYVKMIAKEIATLKGISIDEVAKITTYTAESFFKI